MTYGLLDSCVLLEVYTPNMTGGAAASQSIVLAPRPDTQTELPLQSKIFSILAGFNEHS